MALKLVPTQRQVFLCAWVLAGIYKVQFVHEQNSVKAGEKIC